MVLEFLGQLQVQIVGAEKNLSAHCKLYVLAMLISLAFLHFLRLQQSPVDSSMYILHLNN